jgi:peroxiredoxin Q/BCP
MAKKKPARKPVAAKRPTEPAAAGRKGTGEPSAGKPTVGAKPAAKRPPAKKAASKKTSAARKPAATTPAEPSWPREGSVAPDFTTVAHDGSTVRLSAFKGRPVVLYFYPKDDTPGCTVEACGFRDAHTQFGRHKAVVLGVSPDSPRSHVKFREKHALPFTLLADEDHAVAGKYGAWRAKSMYGKSFMGIARSTFVIDAAGRIARAFTTVKPQGHEREVLAAVAALG